MALCCQGAKAQDQTLEQLGRLIDDAIFFTDLYITPATDAAVYQSASGWTNTPQRAKRWDFTLGLHVNTFLVPNSDRKFKITNEDFSFFTIQGADAANTPTALGNDQYATLNGTLGNDPVTLKTPEGIDRETILYPALQGSLGLGYGTELIGRFSPKITLKHVEYQVYGVGIKHNLSQYFPSVEKKNIYFSALFGYSREDVTVAFLDVQTPQYGSLGLNALNSVINTWQLQLNGSKAFGKLELSAGIISNISNFEYKVSGEKSQIDEIIPLRKTLNKRLEEIYKTKFNGIGEASLRYKAGPVFTQATLAFGQFINTNLAVQYAF